MSQDAASAKREQLREGVTIQFHSGTIPLHISHRILWIPCVTGEHLTNGPNECYPYIIY